MEATVWATSEAEALLLDRSLRFSRQECALEQGWLLSEMEQRFGYPLEELARRFDRSVSWVSRRLALVELLPEAIQQQVRGGKNAAHCQSDFLIVAHHFVWEPVHERAGAVCRARSVSLAAAGKNEFPAGSCAAVPHCLSCLGSSCPHAREKGEQFRAEVVAYADDFVILSRGYAAEARAWTQTVMNRIGLTLNEQKTSIRDGRTEEFDFLGYTFGPLYWWTTGRRYIAARPSKKSLKRFRTSVYSLLRPQETEPWELVRTRLNAMLRGWQNYFSYGPWLGRMQVWIATFTIVFATSFGAVTQRRIRAGRASSLWRPLRT